MGVNRNLLGGIALRDAVKTSMPSATDYPDDRYIQFAANAATSISISEAAGMAFKPNTQYTFIFTLYKTSGVGSNLRVVYTDGTSDNIPDLAITTTKETVILVTDNGKTIDRLQKNNQSGSTRVYYDESGIFEGVLTTLDFEPYQAWGITMSGIRRSLVEAALHDDTTVAAPIATFSTDVAAPAKSVLAAFSPIQDLHGYSNPWPAGGGKNLANYPQMIADGAVEQTDGSLYVASANTFNNKVAFQNNGTAGQFAITFIVKNDSTSRGVYPIIYYTDSTNESVPVNFGYTSFTTITKITNSAKTVDKIAFSYGTGTVKTWFYIQVETGSTATDWSPYSNICPISGRTGLTAYRTGKNLLAKTIEFFSNVPDSLNECFFVKAGIYTVSFSSAENATSWRFGVRMKDESGADISDFEHKPNQYMSWNIYGNMWLGGANSSTKYTTLTFVEDCYIRILMAIGDTSASSVFHDGQLEIGSTASAYEPYSGTTYPATWQTEAGTVYGGTVDVVSGVLTVTDKHATLTAQAKYEDANGSYWYTTHVTLGIPVISGLNAGLICNRLVKHANVGTSTADGNITFYANGIIRWKEQDALSKNDYNTYLASNPLEIVYELKEPLTYQLTPTQIDLLKGTNNLWQSENGDVTVGYWLHG